MAATLGVLDVLSRLREESEKASTALTAQEDTNRGLLQRCIAAETEIGRSDAVKEVLRQEWEQLDKRKRIAETTRREAKSRLTRLQKKCERRDETAAATRKASIAAADAAIESSKKFRAGASASVRQMRELRARLHDKRSELDSVREETNELEEEMNAKKANRDKVKAEVTSEAEAVASACSRVEDADRVNKSTLERAKRVEGEIEEIRQAQEEMHEMAVGLQQKNAILRNELRHLKRDLGADPPRHHHHREASARHDAGNSGTRNTGSWRPTSPRMEGERRHKQGVSTTGGRGGGGRFYRHSAAPQQPGRTAAALQFETSPYQNQDRWNPTNTSNNNSSRTSGNSNDRSNSSNSSRKKVRAPFATAAGAMAMPELRLSSPHPGGRIAKEKEATTMPSSSNFEYHV